MSRAPPSPSFRPPLNPRLKGSLPKIGGLRISTPPNNASHPPKEEISPVELEPPAVVESENVTNNTARRHSGPIELRISPPETTRRRNSQCPDDDIYALDDEGWSRVANSGGIEELLSLGEGVSGAVTKCRLRKSGQVFAIKVHAPRICELMVDNYNRILIAGTSFTRIEIQSILQFTVYCEILWSVCDEGCYNCYCNGIL